MRWIDEHHCNPGEALAVLDRRDASDDLAGFVGRHATSAGTRCEKELPVSGDLIPVRLAAELEASWDVGGTHDSHLHGSLAAMIFSRRFRSKRRGDHAGPRTRVS